MENHRIKVKLGDAEFDAEGKPDVVQAQYEAFLAAVSSMPKAVPPPAQAQAAITLANTTLNANAIVGVPPDVLGRIFRKNGDYLSLAALPNGPNAEQDAMLALLYGYAKLTDEPAVSGTRLMKSARTSGVNFERVDRVMSGLMPEYVLAAGVKKARRYQLNNPGMVKAEQVIGGILK